MVTRSGKSVIRALNRQPLIFGIAWTIYVAAVVVCALIAVLISKAAGGILLFLLSIAGKHVSDRDIQLPTLWAISLFQGGSYDPAKYEAGR